MQPHDTGWGRAAKTFLHLKIIALIQGLTEFLPVSSSGHLILLPNLSGMADQGQAIDVAVHVGTLGCACCARSASRPT